MICIIWEYRVHPEKLDLFRTIYGPDGEWVKLFLPAPGYVETVLLQIPQAAGNAFMTVDFWNSALEFQDFQAKHGGRYIDLDGFCARLTISEQFIGSFNLLSSF
ncbi:MAG: hypothetical protein M3Z14_00720 [Candidatus Eremiobacteraeota bacterium]|nr:hypothetical protein [Candidatus Eremiobacteraeota bacterium]